MITDKHPEMRDSQLSLEARINYAIGRITRGDCNMRIPVEATDPDIVLADCKEELIRLRERVAELMEAVRWARKNPFLVSVDGEPIYACGIDPPAHLAAVIAEAVKP